MSDCNETKRVPRKILGMKRQLSPSRQPDLRESGSTTNYNFLQGSAATSLMDRMRCGNVTNQEMHALWPYGTFLPPVMPGTNLAVPYTLTPNMSYAAALPVYQTTGGSTNQQQTQQNSNAREPSKMMIQIQCVNQNNPVNINSLNDIAASIGKLSLHFEQAETGKKEDLSSLRSSPSSPGSKDVCDSSNISFSSPEAGEPSHVVISQAKFDELKNLALVGSELAEKLAYNHRNRPCFKKIDSLCARMKQDLIRPDGVLPNINSQGIAWAVKDFIFVFTRIISAWIIIKGYVYNTPEGLNKVRSALSPDFTRSFAEWQDSTLGLVGNLIKSFVNLDNLVQTQKNVYHKVVSTTPTKCGKDDSTDVLNLSMESGGSKETATNKNYTYTMIEDSEMAQGQNTSDGTYFKTGTYNFIKRASPDEGSVGLENFLDDTFARSLSNICPTYDLCQSQANLSKSKLNCDIRVLEDKLSKFSSAYDPNLPKPLGKDLVDKFNIFISHLMNLKSANVFFKTQFCQNYFPDFIAKTPDFMDLRAIILKCQTGGYGHIFEIIHDIKLIVYQAREYLKKQPHYELEQAIKSFEADIERILTEEPFENYQFDHIKGKPNEILYNIGK